MVLLRKDAIWEENLGLKLKNEIYLLAKPQTQNANRNLHVILIFTTGSDLNLGP